MRPLVKRHWRISCNSFIGLFSWDHWSKDIGEFHVIFLLGYFHETTLVKRHLRISCNIFIGLFSWDHSSKDIWEFHVIFLLGYFHESTCQKTFKNFMYYFHGIIFMKPLVKRHMRISFLLGYFHESTRQKTLENFM
jgi:hypothetical protein